MGQKLGVTRCGRETLNMKSPLFTLYPGDLYDKCAHMPTTCAKPNTTPFLYLLALFEILHHLSVGKFKDCSESVFCPCSQVLHHAHVIHLSRSVQEIIKFRFIKQLQMLHESIRAHSSEDVTCRGILVFIPARYLAVWLVFLLWSSAI